VPVDAIIEPESPIRTTVTEEGMEELLESIRVHGLLVPVVVVPEGERFRLVCGRRRVLCARALGMPLVPAVVRREGAEWRAWAAVAENRLREEVSAVEEGQWLAGELASRGCTGAELARSLGVTEQWLISRVEITEWPGDVVQALGARLISFAVAREFARIGDDVERGRCVACGVHSGCTSRQAAEWRRAWERGAGLRDVAAEGERSGAGAGGVPAVSVECGACGVDIEAGEGREVMVCAVCAQAIARLRSGVRDGAQVDEEDGEHGA